MGQRGGKKTVPFVHDWGHQSYAAGVPLRQARVNPKDLRAAIST